MKIINKKGFAKVALDENFETFIVHIAALEALLLGLLINPNREAQIVFLFNKKVTILDKYSDFIDIFLEKEALVLPDQTELNQYAIKLEKDK